MRGMTLLEVNVMRIIRALEAVSVRWYGNSDDAVYERAIQLLRKYGAEETQPRETLVKT
jgi:hypothetical protein